MAHAPKFSIPTPHQFGIAAMILLQENAADVVSRSGQIPKDLVYDNDYGPR